MAANEHQESSNIIQLSDVAKQLPHEALDRYLKKLREIGNVDPYAPDMKLSDISTVNKEHLPDVTHANILFYLIHSTSSYNYKELKAYKATDAYQFFMAGWVGKLRMTHFLAEGNVIITSKVRHSQSINETPLSPWIAVKSDGMIVNAHCTCKAGLGEACSHIGATLYAIEAAINLIKNQSCTSQSCSWLAPSFGNVDFAETIDIDFTSPDTKYRRSQETSEKTSSPHIAKKRKTGPTEDEEKEFIKNMADSGVKCAFLSLEPEYCNAFIPAGANLPKPLTQLHDPANLSLTDEELTKKVDTVISTTTVTMEDVSKVEKLTRNQSSSEVWYQQRAGRVTASKFKAAAGTNPASPAPSLIKSICYPESTKFKTSATRWGCVHEDEARKKYSEQMEKENSDFQTEQCGFFIDTNNAFLGASPDGVVYCSCCNIEEKGILEIKCPFCQRKEDFNVAAEDNKFCLDLVDGKLQLNRKHQYYYQVQLQLHVTKADFCDFVVWNELNIHIERIVIDEEFIKTSLATVESVIKNGVIPELLARKVTSQKAKSLPGPSSSSNESATTSNAICYCRIHPYGEIVKCKSNECEIVNFHLGCTRLKSVRNNWLCKNCKPASKSKSKT